VPETEPAFNFVQAAAPAVRKSRDGNVSGAKAEIAHQEPGNGYGDNRRLSKCA
jgi:hypothetical protein